MKNKNENTKSNDVLVDKKEEENVGRLYTEEEVRLMIDTSVYNAVKAERETRNIIETTIPAGYLHIDTIVEHANRLKSEQQILTHEREKSVRWFIDRLRNIAS